MWCEVGRDLRDYNNYGCFCGLGGKGRRPVDDIDRYIKTILALSFSLIQTGRRMEGEGEGKGICQYRC